jgi:hypothetical protein
VRRRSFLLVTLQVLAVWLGLGLGASAAWAAPADERVKRVASLETQRARLDDERRGLEKQLGGKTAEVAGLKKQRASWTRDQKLDVRLREAKDLAGALDRKAEQIRSVDAQLKRERAQLVRDIDGELAGSPAPTPDRQAQLTRWRAEQQRKLAGPRRVEVADEDMSPLDDPEDLLEKAGTLADSEQRLRAEEERLAHRAAFYRKQGKLQRARQRDAEQDLFDDAPRRGGSASGSRGSPATSGDDGAHDPAPLPPSQPGQGGAPPPDEGSGGTGGPDFGGGGDLGEDAAQVYADVVDPTTLVELQRAERSGDPDDKARAADRALRDVKSRADRLRSKRLEMEKRARALREQGH